MGKDQSLSKCVERFLQLSQQIAAGHAGRDYAVSEDDLLGYETTELERALFECSDALRQRIEQNPQELTSELMTQIMQALLNCQPGITGYRARLMRYAGDYGDEISPVATVVHRVRRDGRYALRNLGPAGEAILAGIPKEILDATLTIYYPVEAGEWVDIEQTLLEHLQ